MTDKKLILYERECNVYDHSSGYALRFSKDSPENFHREIYSLCSGKGYSNLVVKDTKNNLYNPANIYFTDLEDLNKKIYLKARQFGKELAAEEGLEFVDETGLESLVNDPISVENSSPIENVEYEFSQ